MIKSNLMPPGPKAAALQAHKANIKPAGKKKIGIKFFFILFLLLAAAVAYLKFFDVPPFLQEIMPQKIAEHLNLKKEDFAAQTRPPRKVEERQPQLIASGVKPKEPAIPLSGSVEEAVETLRPDIIFEGEKGLASGKGRTMGVRIGHVFFFHAMLSTFYEATPDGIGYLDLVYQAPNFYFARIMAIDTSIRNSYINNLRTRVASLAIIDSTAYRDGHVEFSVQGGIQQPSVEPRNIYLTQSSKVNSEILALRALAANNQVRLSGLENPITEKLGTHRIVILKTTTEADYPSLLNFAKALKESNIAFEVQHFASRPASSGRMQSFLEFALYATK
jgi:hypothetical protein